MDQTGEPPGEPNPKPRRRPAAVGRGRCAFDPIIAGEAPVHMVLDEPALAAFLDIRPLFPGHTLVVPRNHVETVADLAPGTAALLWAAAARVAAAQKAVLGAEGTFFGLNDVVSQSVPHVHLHVVPRRFGDGLRGFFWPRGRYPDPEEAEALAASLRAALEGTNPVEPTHAIESANRRQIEP